MSGKRRRALIAARPDAWDVLRELLQDSLDAVPAQNSAEALDLLDREWHRVDLIVSTIGFDDSRMIDFLQAVKSDRKLRAIPFYCFRVLPGKLTDDFIAKTAAVCKQCGAMDFVDVANLTRNAAGKAVRSVLEA